MKNMIFTIKNRLENPADIASLVMLRVVFGLLMSWEMLRYIFNGWVTYTYSRTRRWDEQGWYSPEFDLTHMITFYLS